MNHPSLSPEKQREVCNDLLCIARAGLLAELAELRRQMLRENLPPSPWQMTDADRLARQASTFIGGSRDCWQQAAAAALGAQTQIDVSIEAVCRVAEDAFWRERQAEQQRPKRPTLSVGRRKRGGR